MTVTLADGNEAAVSGKGSGTLMCLDEIRNQHEVKLTEVLHVPSLDAHLVSVGRLTEKGADVLFTQNTCKIMKNDKVIATADKSEGLYRLNLRRNKSIKANMKHPKNCIHG